MSADTAWWEGFFSGSNGLHWEALSTPGHPWSGDVLPWIALARAASPDLTICLPRLDAAGAPSWYCAARGRRGSLRLREALQAFVGPSYSDFEGRPYPLSPDDEVEAAFAEGTVAPAYRVRPASPDDVPRIRRALELYLGLVERMPDSAERGPRPLGFLRAELDRAVLAGNEPEARRLMERIRTVGRLDAENLLFLEVEVRAGLGHWRDIAADAALLSSLIGLRLPPRVLADLVEALYRVHVEPRENKEAPEEALEAFRRAGLVGHAHLFGSRRGVQHPRVLKAFFLFELCRENRDPAQLKALADALLEVPRDPFAAALVRLLPQPEPAADKQAEPSEAFISQAVAPAVPTANPMAAADEAFYACEIDRALTLYLAAPPSPKRLSQLIRCAEDIGTAEAAGEVLAALDPGDGAERLPETMRRRLSNLQQVCGREEANAPPRGWLEWARRVATDPLTTDGLSLLRDHGPTWDVEALVGNLDAVADLAMLLGNAEGAAADVFREATAYIYQSLAVESGAPVRTLKPLMQVLLARLALLEDPSRDELELARDLAATLLTTGLDREGYADLVADLQELQGAQASLVNLSWSLDLAELLAIHACPGAEVRLRFVVGVVDVARRLAHRLTYADRLVVEYLCRDCGLHYPSEFAQESADDTTGDDRLSGKKVGIYTLIEPAGQRAALLLERIYPTIQVELNADHECTSRLIALARSADLFVFAWKSSKHQAYYCVKDHRDPKRALLLPVGKGSSSILQAILHGV